MKRDWDLIRKQLTDVEQERSLFVDIPAWPDMSSPNWESVAKDVREIENRILGHYELLINSGYIDGLTIKRGSDGGLGVSEHSPRLTMTGHDLLDTIRSKTIWEKIKSVAQSKGIELTFDTVKALASYALSTTLQG